jgi:hypothetical protein
MEGMKIVVGVEIEQRRSGKKNIFTRKNCCAIAVRKEEENI